ncbi:hypothetical protein SNEBB_005281 [Seison nebaliae]|nr:hypothetical protein SNEBB_005281 [Seison nebaliae]
MKKKYLNLSSTQKQLQLNQTNSYPKDKNLSPPHNQIDYNSFNAVTATQYGAIDRLRLLVEDYEQKHSDDVNAKKTFVNTPDVEGCYLLHWASINGREKLIEYLISCGADVNCVGGNLHSTPIYWATKQGLVNIIGILIHYGADVSLVDNEGCSILHLAAQLGYSEIIAYLVAKGMDVNLIDKRGYTPLMYTVSRIYHGEPIDLLIRLGADVNCQIESDGNSALHLATANSNLTAIERLLKAGASPMMRDNEKRTSFDVASSRQSPLLSKLLEKNIKEKDSFLSLPMRRIFYITIGVILLLFQSALNNYSSSLVMQFIIIIIFLLIMALFSGMSNFRPFEQWLGRSCLFYFYTVVFATYILYERHSYLNLLIYLLLYISCIINYFNCNFHKPLTIEMKEKYCYQEIIELCERNEMNSRTFCVKCLKRRPLRSFHSDATQNISITNNESSINRCIVKYELDSIYFDHPIGEGNSVYFYRWNIFHIILNCWTIVALFNNLYQNCHTTYRVNGILIFIYQILTCSPWLLCCIIISSICLLSFPFRYCTYIFYAIKNGMTIYEASQKESIKFHLEQQKKFQKPLSAQNNDPLKDMHAHLKDLNFGFLMNSIISLQLTVLLPMLPKKFRRRYNSVRALRWETIFDPSDIDISSTHDRLFTA